MAAELTAPKKKRIRPYVRKQAPINPQQAQFLSLYLDPKSPLMGNAMQCALKVGFSPSYAENITHILPEWLSENIGKDRMLIKAERNLEEFLDLEPVELKVRKDGVEYQKTNSEVLKVKADITKFVASTVGKIRYGAKANDGGDFNVQINITNYEGSHITPSLPAEGVPSKSA